MTLGFDPAFPSPPTLPPTPHLNVMATLVILMQESVAHVTNVWYIAAQHFGC